MAKNAPKYEYKAAGLYDIEQRDGETDMQYYTRLAKAADQRMVRLEKLEGEPGFENVTKYAYARAQRDLESYGKSGDKLRFNTKAPEDRRLFREKIMDMRAFLSSPTSTKKGIIEVYKKKADSINKIYGTNFTWQDLADLFGSGDADKLFKEYGSKTVLHAIGWLQQGKEDIKKKVESNGNKKGKGGQIAADVAAKIVEAGDTQLTAGMSDQEREALAEQLRGKKKGTKKKKTEN